MTDHFGKDASDLRSKKLWLFDMDGTVYEEETLFEGVPELLEVIRGNGGNYVFITNNSSKSLDDYVEKVNRLGIKAGRENFFTSVHATILYLKENHPGKKVYCQGTKSLIKELFENGISITEEVDTEAGVVLVGFDTELTSEKLRKTCEMLRQDIPYIATNPDLVCPVSFGFIPDCGSICQMLENATGRRPVYIGKPEPVMVEMAMERFGVECGETVVVGDRLYTDVAAGLNAGVTAVCVLTGEATVKDIENGRIKPTLTFGNVKEIWEILC